ncbi:hypothetical protein DMB42_07910 [Nonomuraea sp. WAC 01424]|uniref:hypothetical protein n=1 Tax=Nonomuraea sp. WAC 01424 TaxID=2203200 RepID=UPI000F7A49EE|nr:hypothetical protein [Nonomuraea sp. WAC 01424]RSN14424.1 hypothetical protein DMB42_07910 [Nonomuraea sp. WAC 01424]
MTRLRDALDGIAEEAPPADLAELAELAVTGYRRRRRATATLAAVATVAVLTGVTATVLLAMPRRMESAAAQSPAAVPTLPAGQVGVLSHAYRPGCRPPKKKGGPPDCPAAEWLVVTRDGVTYRMPQALAETKRSKVPVAISRDGRMLAYYSREAGAHVVRDMVTGAETVSPVAVPEERIGRGSMLVVSDDGRYVAFDPREGTKDPGLLIDMRTGRTVSVPGVYEPVSIKDGVAELVRYIKTDLLLMPVTGGGRPVRFDGVFIMFSELAPDGRTVAAFEFPDKGKGTPEYATRRLTLLDARSGRILRKVAVKGLPKGAGIHGTTIWQSPSEVTLLVQRGQAVRAYAVDVRTGGTRLVTEYSEAGKSGGAVPGAAGS